MRFNLFKNATDEGMEDSFFRPFESMRSPVDTEEIRRMVLAHSPSPSSYLSELVRQLLLMGSASALVLTMFVSPSEFRDVRYRSSPTKSSTRAPIAPSVVVSANPIRVLSNITKPALPSGSVKPVISEEQLVPLARSLSMVQAINAPPIVANGIESWCNNRVLAVDTRDSLPEAPTEQFHPFAAAGAGAFAGHFRMAGEYAAVGVREGPMFVQVSLLNASKGRDNRDVQTAIREEAQRGTPSESIRWSENNRQVALMAGLSSRIFGLEASLAVGPSYMYSTTTSVDALTGTIGSPQYTQGFGASAQASLTYSLSDRLHTGLTGVINYQGWTSGALLVSINFGLQ